MRKFELTKSCHGMMAIQADDMSKAECWFLAGMIRNNYIDSDDYKNIKSSGPFLQGYDEPHNDTDTDGWVLVEFWTDNKKSVLETIQYINKRFQSDFKQFEEEWLS